MQRLLRGDWKWILLHAWSAKFMMLAVVLTGLEAFLQFFPWFDFMSDMQFAFTMLFISIAALVARVVAQNSFTKRYHYDE